MVWKLHKIMVGVLFRCAILVCSGRAGSGELESQLNKLHRLKRIIVWVRQYYGLHPNYARDTYGTMENYLRQHIAEYDWALLTQLPFTKSNQDSILHSTLDVA